MKNLMELTSMEIAGKSLAAIEIVFNDGQRIFTMFSEDAKKVRVKTDLRVKLHQRFAMKNSSMYKYCKRKTIVLSNRNFRLNLYFAGEHICSMFETEISNKALSHANFVDDVVNIAWLNLKDERMLNTHLSNVVLN